jgi:transposase
MPQGRQVINGREYVYEYRSIWNKEKQRSEQKREYLGRIIDGQFVPNKTYLLREELAKKTDTIDERSVPAVASKRLFAGATYLFDKISEITGIADDIKASFPGIHKELQSLSYYLALEPYSPMYRFSRWAQTHDHPCGRNIPSQRCSELLPLITEEAKMDFLRRFAKRQAENEYLFYDTTSIGSYSEQLKQVKYGYSKNNGSLAQINLALMLGQESGLPVYYRKLPGNITDVTTIDNLLINISYLCLKKVCLVMDRGFYSEKNINAMFKGHHKFIIGAKRSLKFVQKHLDVMRYDFERRENFNSETELFIMSKVVEWDYRETKRRSGENIKDKRRMYMHIYYNDKTATNDKLRFYKLLDTLEEEITTGKRKESREKLYNKYYTISQTPVRGVKIEPKQDAIDAARKNFGFFVLLSNKVKDPVEALKLYRTKDMIEKAFSDLKGRLGMRRPWVSSEEHLEGKLFIQFLSLIYLSYIKRCMDNNGLFKNYTMQELFDELDLIEKFHQPGRSAYYGEITDKQRKLYTTLGFEPPA